MHSLLEQLQLGLEKGLCGLTAEQTRLRTNGDPARWTIQQIVEHLLMTYELSTGTVEKRIASGRPTEARLSLQQRIGQMVVLKLGRFPQGRQAPAMVMPSEPVVYFSGDQLSDRTRAYLGRFNEAAEKAEALFGSRRAITHQVLGPMNVEGWRQFHKIHGEHHLKQVAAVRGQHGCQVAGGSPSRSSATRR